MTLLFTLGKMRRHEWGFLSQVKGLTINERSLSCQWECPSWIMGLSIL